MIPALRGCAFLVPEMMALLLVTEEIHLPCNFSLLTASSSALPAAQRFRWGVKISGHGTLSMKKDRTPSCFVVLAFGLSGS